VAAFATIAFKVFLSRLRVTGQITQSPSSPSSNPRNSSFTNQGLPCSAMAQAQHAHNGRVCRADLRPSRLPNSLSCNSYNESIFGRLVLPLRSPLEPPNLCPSPGPALFSPSTACSQPSRSSLCTIPFVCMTSTFVIPSRSKSGANSEASTFVNSTVLQLFVASYRTPNSIAP
jgi:hypothetical protein